jgi:hypothetical protein
MFEDILKYTNIHPIGLKIIDIIDYITENFKDQEEVVLKRLIFDEIENIIMLNCDDLNFNLLYLNFEILKNNSKFKLNPINKQTQELFKKLGVTN